MAPSSFVIAPAVAALGAVSFVAVGTAARTFTRKHFTILDDLKSAGQARPAEKKLHKRVVICGGSIGGLLAARVCSDHFDEVVVIDPDNETLLANLDNEDVIHPKMNEDKPGVKPVTRARVMQGNAFHATQPMYLTGLRRYFPDVDEEIKKFNAPLGSGEYNIHIGGVSVPGPAEYFSKGLLQTFGMTRAAHETLLRRLVRRHCPSVEFITGTVTGVTRTSKEEKKLSAVTYRLGQDTTAQSLEADLVIDCTGVAHAGLTWLQRAGFSLERDALLDSYHPHMRYTSAEFKVNPDAIDKIVPADHDKEQPALIFLAPAPGVETRYLCMLRAEGDRITMLIGGSAWPEKATSVDFIREYTKSLRQKIPTPEWVYDLYDYLEAECADTAFYTDCQTSALHDIRYASHTDSLPSNFVALGDSVTRLNPVNGQGISKALVETIILDSRLRDSSASSSLPSTFAADFFKMSHVKTAFVWNGNKAADYALPTCDVAKGETKEHGNFMRWYNGQIGKLLLQGDRDVALRFWEIRHWLAPPTDMFAPSVVGKVLRNVVLAKLS